MERLSAAKPEDAPTLGLLVELKGELGNLLGESGGHTREALALAKERITVAERLRDRYPTHILSYTRLTGCWASLGKLLEREEKWDDAANAYRRALAYDVYLTEHVPHKPSDRENSGDLREKLGRVMLRQGKYSEAEKLLTEYIMAAEILATEYRDVVGYSEVLCNAYLNLAQVYLLTGRRAEAEAAYGKHFQRLETLPLHSILPEQKVWSRVTCPVRRFWEPEKTLERARRLAGDDPAALPHKAYVLAALVRAGQSREAIALAETIRQESGSTPSLPSLFFLALAHNQVGEREEARRCYDRAVRAMEERNPSSPEMRVLKQEVEEALRP